MQPESLLMPGRYRAETTIYFKWAEGTSRSLEIAVSFDMYDPTPMGQVDQGVRAHLTGIAREELENTGESVPQKAHAAFTYFLMYREQLFLLPSAEAS